MALAAVMLWGGSFLLESAAGQVVLAVIMYFTAELFRKSSLFHWLGLPEVGSLPDIFRARRYLVSFIARKSTWVAVPLIYMWASPKLGPVGFGLLPIWKGPVHLIIFGVLAGFSFLMYLDAKGMGISAIAYLKSFLMAFLAAGFPEDFLIIGVIGGSVFRLIAMHLPPLGAKILTVLVVESLFCLAHIPMVRRAKAFYSKQMTLGSHMSYGRMFLQMFLISLPGWAFYFLSSHIYFSAWWHALADIAAFLPKKADGEI